MYRPYATAPHGTVAICDTNSDTNMTTTILIPANRSPGDFVVDDFSFDTKGANITSDAIPAITTIIFSDSCVPHIGKPTKLNNHEPKIAPTVFAAYTPPT